MPGALDGIRVIDMTEGAQGPWATALMGDLGADVIKIEKPDGDFMRPGPVFKGMNHGKRTICLYLKDSEDLAILKDLTRTADVFMENYRPGVTKRLGVDYESLKQINPRLIYCSASGFGQTGTYGPKASMEAISAAMGAYGSLQGPAGGLGEKPRTQVIDFTSPLPVIQGILLALLHRSESGRGQYIQCSQLQSLSLIESVRIAEYTITGEKPVPMGTAIPYAVPSQAFKTADWYIFVECRDERDWAAFCQTIHLPALADNPKFNSNANRVDNRAELVPQLEKAFSRYGAKTWLNLLAAAGVPCSPIYLDIEDLYEEPQVAAGGMVVERQDESLGMIRTPGVAWELSETPAQYGPFLTTELDGDRESILTELAALKSGQGAV